MPIPESDLAYLWDMRDAARQAAAIIEAQSVEAFSGNAIHKLALERAFEIIGEAARRISDETRNAAPDIPWRQIIGQRNIIAHEYGRVDHVLLYWTVVEKLPHLVDAIDALLGE